MMKYYVFIFIYPYVTKVLFCSHISGLYICTQTPHIFVNFLFTNILQSSFFSFDDIYKEAEEEEAY